ncbi:hypothetical protein HanOQP8_Chr11g0403821 [Helianthus annuus]|nr:hypothetical protein HanOQP8_Chr11g0403821 [Helianthus annuus]
MVLAGMVSAVVSFQSQLGSKQVKQSTWVSGSVPFLFRVKLGQPSVKQGQLVKHEVGLMIDDAKKRISKDA